MSRISGVYKTGSGLRRGSRKGTLATSRRNARKSNANKRVSKSSNEYYKGKLCEIQGCQNPGQHSIARPLKPILACVKHKKQYSIKV